MIRKRNYMLFWVASCCVASSHLGHTLTQESRRSDSSVSEVKTKYVGSNGYEIEILGVASIKPDRVDCWDLNGKRSPSLAEDTRRYFDQTYAMDFYICPGLKNRYLVCRRSKSNLQVDWSVEGKFAGQAGSWTNSQDHTIQIVRFAVDPSTKQATPRVEIFIPQQSYIDIPLKILQRFQINSCVYTFDRMDGFKVEGKPYRADARKYSGSAWTLHFKQSIDAKESHFLTTCVPLDAQNKPIEYVDLKGNPVSKQTYLTDPDKADLFYENGNVFAGSQGQTEAHRYMKVILNISSQAQKEVSVFSNVNPVKIRSIRAYYTNRERAQFAPVPLDPKDAD